MAVSSTPIVFILVVGTLCIASRVSFDIVLKHRIHASLAPRPRSPEIVNNLKTITDGNELRLIFQLWTTTQHSHEGPAFICSSVIEKASGSDYAAAIIN